MTETKEPKSENQETKTAKKSQTKPDPVNNFLANTSIMLENATIPEILEELKKININEQFIENGKTLYNSVLTLQAVYQKQQGESKGASQKFSTLMEESKLEYMEYFKIAKILFKDDNKKIESLNLSGKRKTTINGFFNQAEQFYQNILGNNENIEKFTTFIPEEKIKNSYEKLKAALKEDAVRKSEKADIKNAKTNLDNKFSELRQWAKDFKILAKIALKEKTYLLDKLMI